MSSNPAAPPGAGSPRPDRRAAARYVLRQALYCRVFAADGLLLGAAALVDISAGGVGLYLMQPLEPGTPIKVEPMEGPGSLRRSLAASVVHTNAHPEVGYLLGAAFERPLGPGDLKRLTE